MFKKRLEANLKEALDKKLPDYNSTLSLLEDPEIKQLRTQFKVMVGEAELERLLDDYIHANRDEFKPFL